MTSSVLLKRYQIISLPSEAPFSGSGCPPCSLKWRSRVLWVRATDGGNRLSLPALENERWLIDCLSRSKVREVCLDPALGAEAIEFWANACGRAGKTPILRLSGRTAPIGREFLSWRVKRLLDRAIAAFLLLLSGPIFLALAYKARTDSSGPLFSRQWRVGENGRLFQLLEFRPARVDADSPSPPGTGDRRRYGLDELPRLVNVLRGEISFVGTRPGTIPEALRPGSPARKHGKALPGITGLWRLTERAEPRDPGTIERRDLEYLRAWTLWKDLAILLGTIPAVLSGTGDD
ncbi:heterocyst development glycosyltransferase HepC [Pannus brasiliensis CCIBt3594]|uniref:Heterocyst development glycosyltransferase HepC n=1 Tax=Pannus brasiliensis CCIBt3594 TaxID=1427578 RepID=A0AAW9R1E6_9CHRO